MVRKVVWVWLDSGVPYLLVAGQVWIQPEPRVTFELTITTSHANHTPWNWNTVSVPLRHDDDCGHHWRVHVSGRAAQSIMVCWLPRKHIQVWSLLCGNLSIKKLGQTCALTIKRMPCFCNRCIPKIFCVHQIFLNQATYFSLTLHSHFRDDLLSNDKCFLTFLAKSYFLCSSFLLDFPPQVFVKNLMI